MNDTRQTQGTMCVPNKRRQLPKATSIPDRKVLIVKCGNYESDSISERLEKHSPYPIKLPETQILSLSSVDRPIETKPNSNNWEISNCHSINLGRGEDSTGAMVKHPGVWFARDRFLKLSHTKFFADNLRLWKKKRGGKQLRQIDG